jgi:Asp-tRNA(Asn)/Glu-tRNA(Gln) amidotransferase A subunit family amidase
MRDMDEFMADLDMYVSPSGDSNLTNHTGHPVVVVPYQFRNGQPQCLVVVGALFADDKLLSVAHSYQSATRWHLKHPEIS